MNPIRCFRRFFELIAPLFQGPSLEESHGGLPPAIVPVPSGGVVRIGRQLPSYALQQRLEAAPKQCQGCWFYNVWDSPHCEQAPAWHVSCAVHPQGPGEGDCLDRRLLPTSDEPG